MKSKASLSKNTKPVNENKNGCGQETTMGCESVNAAACGTERTGRAHLWRTILWDNFRKYWTVPAIGLFWLLVCGVVPILLSSRVVYPSVRKETVESMALNLNPGYVLGILILAIGVGMTVFSYLMNPGASNYIHSLPVRRGRLFAEHVLSGLLMITAPLLINAIAMSLVTGYPLLFLKWFVCTEISCFAIFGVTAFAAMLSGNTLMHLFNTVFFNSILSLVLLTVYALSGEMLLGYERPEGWIQLLMNSNALIAFIGSDYPRWIPCVIYGLVGAAALAAACGLYRRRAIERTGSSVMFSWVRSLLFIVCVFCGSVLTGLVFLELLGNGHEYRLNVNMIIGMIVGALLVYVVGSIMIDRTARIFTRNNLLPAALALLLAFGVTAGLGADVLGYSSRVPATDEVQRVYLSLSSDMTINGDSQRFDAGFYKNANEDNTAMIEEHRQMGFAGTETKTAVQDLHRGLIEQDRNQDYQTGTITILYELKNGRRMIRSYGVYGSEENHDASSEKAVMDALRAFYETEEFKETYSLKNLKSEVFPDGTAVLWTTTKEGEEIESRAIPYGDMESLQAALEEDFQASTYDECIAAETSIRVAPAGSSWEELSFPVTKRSKAMQIWLKEHKDILQ